MTQIDYKKVKCPKCGKSYFKVKNNSGVGFTTLVFITKPDPIYKDGELQNPTEAEPIKVRCECLECECNFRVETHDVFGEYRFIDEDEERKESERKLAESFKMLKREAEKTKELLVETPCEIESCQLKISKPQFVNLDVKPVFDEFPNTWQDGLKEKLDEIKEKLAKLESKQ